MRGPTVTVTVIRPDDPSFPTMGDRPATTSTDIAGCHLFPTRTGKEGPTFDSDTVSVDAVVVAPIGSDVKVTDQVQIAGKTYDVANSPYELQSPFTGTDRGLAIPLRTWTG